MSAKKERNTGLKLDPKNWPGLQHDTTIRGRKWCCGDQLSAATNRVLYYDHEGGLLVGPLPFEFDWRNETPHGEALFLESRATTVGSGCCCLVASSLDCAFAIRKMAELPMYSAKLELLSKQHMCNHASVWRGFCDRLLAVCFKSHPYGGIIILDESKLCLQSIIRIDHPSQEEIMRLLHVYPLVTCIRCKDLSNRLLNGDGVYRGTYDMHRLLHCVVLVGYTRSDWILFNSSSGPAFGMNGFFKIRRSDQSGVGEFVMLPQVHP